MISLGDEKSPVVNLTSGGAWFPFLALVSPCWFLFFYSLHCTSPLVLYLMAPHINIQIGEAERRFVYIRHPWSFLFLSEFMSVIVFFFFFFLVETSCVILRPLSFRRRCGRHESHRVTQQTVLRHHQVGPGHLSRLSLVAMHEILWSIRQTHFVLLLLSQSLWLIQQKASKLWWPEYCFQLASVVFTICLSRDPFARAS